MSGTVSSSNCNSSYISGDERSTVSSMKLALERISLKDNSNKDELGESGIESQGSNGEEEECETNSLDGKILLGPYYILLISWSLIFASYHVSSYGSIA